MDNNSHYPKCYGSDGHGKFPVCAACEYYSSCRYYAATAAQVESRSHLASFDEVQEWLTDAADYDHIPGEQEEISRRQEKSCFISMLGRFFRFLLELDDYTIGIICEVISPHDPERKSCSVTALSKLHGCSRQAMHRKILDIIAHRPELALLLKSTMYKLTRSRECFLRHRKNDIPLKGC